MADEEEVRDLSQQRGPRARAQRADQLHDDREQLATDLAVQNALRQERVDQRFTNVEAQVKAINGSVKRAGDNFATLSLEVAALKSSIDKIHAAQDQRDAVAEALRKAVERANESQISNRMFISGVATIIIAIVGLVLSHG